MTAHHRGAGTRSNDLYIALFHSDPHLHWKRVKSAKSPTLTVLTATVRGSSPLVARPARAPGRVGHGPTSRALAPVHMRRAQPSADRLFRDLCEIVGTGQRPASSIGTPSGSATGLDRVAHVMASTIVSTVTCAHQHDEDDKGHRRAAKEWQMRKLGALCARWGSDAGASEAVPERPNGSKGCAKCLPSLLSTWWMIAKACGASTSFQGLPSQPGALCAR